MVQSIVSTYHIKVQPLYGSVQPFDQSADEQEDEVDDPKTEKARRSTHSPQSSISSGSSLVLSTK